MTTQRNNNNYSAYKEQVKFGLNTWENIFFDGDKKPLLQIYENLSVSAREVKAFYIEKKHRLQQLGAVESDAKWFIDLALELNDADIKRARSREYKFLYAIDKINGVKPKSFNSFNIEAIKEVPISTFLQSGRDITGEKSLHLCPLHNEKTPSFHYYKKQNTFACYGCGKAGDNIQFIMELHNYTFKEACGYLSKML